jgi:hypothetical protein
MLDRKKILLQEFEDFAGNRNSCNIEDLFNYLDLKVVYKKL